MVNKSIKKKEVPVVSQPKKSFDFAFGRINYILMLIGIVFIGLGYVFLAGGGSKDPNVFNYALFDTQRLVIAPIFLMLGFILEIFAIMVKSKNKE